MQQQGHDTCALMERVRALVVKTMLSVAPHLKRTYRSSTQSTRAHAIDSTPSRCFELLGFDVLMDDKLNPVLMEVRPLAPSLLPQG